MEKKLKNSKKNNKARIVTDSSKKNSLIENSYRESSHREASYSEASRETSYRKASYPEASRKATYSEAIKINRILNNNKVSTKADHSFYTIAFVLAKFDLSIINSTYFSNFNNLAKLPSKYLSFNIIASPKNNIFIFNTFKIFNTLTCLANDIVSSIFSKGKYSNFSLYIKSLFSLFFKENLIKVIFAKINDFIFFVFYCLMKFVVFYEDLFSLVFVKDRELNFLFSTV